MGWGQAGRGGDQDRGRGRGRGLGLGQGCSRSRSRYLPVWMGLGEAPGGLITHGPCRGPVHQPWARVLSPRDSPTTSIRAIPAAAPRVASASPDSWRSVFHVCRPGRGRVASSLTGGCKLWSRHALVGTDQVPLLSPGLHVGLMLMDNPISVHSLS